MIGQIVSHYRILERLGKGGMGVVYKAEDTRLGRTVAIKFLPEGIADDAIALERFHREARAASALNHPNIVTVHEIGETESGSFLVMEWIQGETLRSRMKRSLDLATLIDYGIQVARALKIAHQAGIIHRDIKPENIMVRSDGYLKLVDFGLARVGIYPDEKTVSLGITKEGSWMGTIDYFSLNRRVRSLWNGAVTFSPWALCSSKRPPECTRSTLVVRPSARRMEFSRRTLFRQRESTPGSRRRSNVSCCPCCRRMRVFVHRRLK